jgi:hypothetical protein
MKTPPKLVSVIEKARAQGSAVIAAEKLMPLEYMLAVMRDPKATQLRRDRMAIAAAPFCHPRMADTIKGKKDQQADAAATAGGPDTGWANDLEVDSRAN